MTSPAQIATAHGGSLELADGDGGAVRYLEDGPRLQTS